MQVVALDPLGGARNAGFRPGDVISEVGGRPVVDTESLRAALRRHLPGDQVMVSARRGASSFSRTVKLGSLSIPFLARQGQSREALDADHRRFLDAGYRPAYITAYPGRSRKPTYAGLWLKDDHPFIARVEATTEIFEKQARELPDGYRLDWLGISGEGNERRCSAVWVADPDRYPWEYHNELGRSQLIALIDERARQGYRPTMIRAIQHAGPEARYAGVWLKDGTPVLARVHLTAEELQHQVDTLSAGWRPEWVDAYKEGGRRYYTAIFIKDVGRAE